jgi:hypothetical protein
MTPNTRFSPAREQRVERAREQPPDRELTEGDEIEDFFHREPL